MITATNTHSLVRRWAIFLVLIGFVVARDAAAQPWTRLSPIHTSLKVQDALNKIAAQPASAEVIVLTARHTNTWNGDTWTLDNQSLLSYEGVRRVEESQYQWFDNGEFGIATRTLYTWSDQGFLTERREEWNVDAQVFEPVDRYTYFFAADGKTASSVFYDVWNGTEFLSVERTTYTFDENLVLTGGEVGLWNGASWDPTERFTLTHDGANVIQLDQYWTGFDWEYATRTVFQSITIPELFERVEKFAATFEDYAGLNYGVRFLPPMGILEWDGTRWVNVERTIHDMYDMFTGDVTRILSLEWDGDRWVQTIAHHFEYDTPTRQPTTIEVKAFDGETTWTTVLRESYEIDSMGDIAAAVIQYDLGEGLENVARVEFNWMHLAVGIEDNEVPADYRLEAAYPNPFNPATTIAFQTSVTGTVALRIYDTLGRQVATLVEGVQSAGRHEVAFRADNLPSGHYVVRLEAPGFNQARLITLVK